MATLSRALLAAVATDQEEAAWDRARELAAAVLASPTVQLATAVAKGGPLAMTRALELAERLLEQEARAQAPAAVGHGS